MRATVRSAVHKRWVAALGASMLAVVVLAAACAGADGEAATSNTTTGPEGAAESDSGTNSESSGGAVASAGCSDPVPQAMVKQRETLDVDGTERWYLITAPGAESGTEPVPLVFDFHGLAEGAEFHSSGTGWSELAESEGFVAVFPHGTGTPAAWNVASSGPNPDLDFIDAMVSEVEQQHCVDTSRIYATGLSNGAFMSSVIACSRSSVFAAVAPVAGLTRPPDCATESPVPVLNFHGTADPLLPFNGTVSPAALGSALSGESVSTTTAVPGDIDGEGYPANAAAWADANGCGEPTDEQVTDMVVRRVWDCPDHADVEFYMITGGGHTWPGSDALTNEGIVAIVGPTTFDIDATELAWEFFGHQQLQA